VAGRVRLNAASLEVTSILKQWVGWFFAVFELLQIVHVQRRCSIQNRRLLALSPVSSNRSPVSELSNCSYVLRQVRVHLFNTMHRTFSRENFCRFLTEVRALSLRIKALSPHLHSTTTKVMVIVWRFRGNIIRTVLYWQCAISSVNENSSYIPVGPWVFLFYFVKVEWFICVFFTLDGWVMSLHVLALV